MAFSDDLRRRLRNHGHSVAGVARRLGCTPRTVYAWLAGQKIPSAALAAELRAALPGLDVPERERSGRPRMGFDVEARVRLTKEQADALREASHRTGRAMACLLREAVVSFLAGLEG